MAPFKKAAADLDTTRRLTRAQKKKNEEASAQLTADSLEATASASNDEDAPVVPKKKRGRPKGSKNKPPEDNTQTSEPKDKPGRASKQQEVPSTDDGSPDAEPVGPKLKRGRSSEPKNKPGRASKQQEVPSTDDGSPDAEPVGPKPKRIRSSVTKVKAVNAQAQINASEPELPAPEQQLELLPKQPDQAGQQLVQTWRRRGRPKIEKPNQAEQQREAPKTEQQREAPKRGRPTKDQTSQAIVVSPGRAKPKPKESEKKSISQCRPTEFVKTVLGKLNEMVQNDPSKGPKIDSLLERIKWDRVPSIQPVTVNKQLGLSLIDCFETDNEGRGYLVINGQHIAIKPLMSKLIPLSNEGKAVKYNDKYDYGESDLVHMFTVPGKGKSIPAPEGLKYLDNVENELLFCATFILEAFAFIFAPKANRNLERDYLQFFKDITEVVNLKDLNWCDIIADLLTLSINKYKKEGYKKCGGCLLILVLIFHDLVTEVPEGKMLFPRANHVTEDDLKPLGGLTTDDFKKIAKKAKPLAQLYKEYGLDEPSDQL